MVSTLAPSACQANMVQDFTALPSTCTTQAPHCEVSQPTWVPVRRSVSRRNWTSKVRASASPLTALPFTVMETEAISLLLRKSGAEGPHFDAGSRLRRESGAKSRRFCRKSQFGTRTTLNPGRRQGQGSAPKYAPVPVPQERNLRPAVHLAKIHFSKKENAMAAKRD